MPDGSHRHPFRVAPLRSDRPYRKAMPHQYALEETSRNAGSQFVPQVVEAFRRVGMRGLIRHEDTMREHAVPLPYAAM